MSLLDSPLNTSPSKQKYSFPKNDRFKEKYESNCSQAFYVLPPIRSDKCASLGYGNKYDFSKMSNKYPGPNAYNVSRDFDAKALGQKGISIGIGRENLYSNNKNVIPGPGTYSLKGTLKSRDISFGIKGLDSLIPKQLLSIPGPGTYQISSTLTPEGKYYLSKIRNPPVHSFNTPTERSALYSKDNRPGPGHYVVKSDFHGVGTYFLSNFKSHNAPKFANSCRTEPTIRSSLQNPGPGTYDYPSDFGKLPPVKVITKI